MAIPEKPCCWRKQCQDVKKISFPSVYETTDLNHRQGAVGSICVGIFPCAVMELHDYDN